MTCYALCHINKILKSGEIQYDTNLNGNTKNYKKTYIYIYRLVIELNAYRKTHNLKKRNIIWYRMK